MKHLLAVLLLVAASFDAIPVNALLAIHAGKPVAACCCRGACHCRRCSVHHPGRAKTPAGMCVLDVAGCTGAGGRSVPAAGRSVYDVPATAALRVRPSPTAVPAVARSPVSSLPRRAPEPPPRTVIA